MAGISEPFALCYENGIVDLRLGVEAVSADASGAVGEQLTAAANLVCNVYTPGATTPIALTTRIINPETGIYAVRYGDPTAAVNIPAQTETDEIGPHTFVWTWATGTGAALRNETSTQVLNVIPVAAARFITALRGYLDKARKRLDTDPANYFPLGFSDAMLFSYLEGGLSIINQYQPYPTGSDVATFPWQFHNLLLDAACVVALNAQELFAIDTDLPNFGDQGHSFSLDHQAKIAAFTQKLLGRLDTMVPKFKLHFVQMGGTLTQVGPSLRFQNLISSSPAGSMFRGVYYSGN